MYTKTASNENGSCYLDIFINSCKGETLYIATISIEETENRKGLYKEYTFKTYRAAFNKYEALRKKYSIE